MKYKITNTRTGAVKVTDNEELAERFKGAAGYKVELIDSSPAAKNGEKSPSPAARKPEESNQPEENKTLKQLASELVETVGNAPSVIKEGVKRNPAGVISTAALNTAIPNSYAAYREGRYAGIPLGLGLDALQVLSSPLKMLRLGGKMLGLSNRLVNPVTKSSGLLKGLGRNARQEAIIGLGDNLAFEAAADALDDRSHSAGDYAASGLAGGFIGLGASPLHLRAQKMNSNEYAKWLPESPKSNKERVKQRIRNAQNDTESDFETFSKLVSEGHPLTTTKGHQNKATGQREKIENQMDDYKSTPEANAPLENATLSDFQDMLDEKIYKDHSGNLAQTEKDLVFKNFYNDAADILVANSPRAQNYLETLSQAELGNPKAYLSYKDFIDNALDGYSLSPNEINMMRQAFSGRTTLVIPAKPGGYVRAGIDNRDNNEYFKLFKDYIDKTPETKINSELNKNYSKARNHEELAGKVLGGQGHGGIPKRHFPYLELNPEANPTVLGNNPLKVRNATNQLGLSYIDYKRQPEEDREETNKVIYEMVEDAKKMGITTQEGIEKYVLSRLKGSQPAGEIIGYSEQKRGEK